MPFEERRTSTRARIIKHGLKLFLDEGYSATTVNKIAKQLKLSPGNITFYFPTKEHLLDVLVVELFAFLSKLMDEEIQEGYTSLMSYCLELAAVASICEEDEKARDFYLSIYTSPMTFNRIRTSDVERMKKIFGEYCESWTDIQWREAENIVSGIEYATIATREHETPLDIQISGALNVIMLLFGVPEDTRKKKIEKVLSVDYRAIGRKVLHEFREYANQTNKKALQVAKKRTNK